MRKIIVLILAMTMLFGMNVFGTDIGVMPISVEILDETELFINGEKIIFSDYAVEPYNKEEGKMLPLRAVVENLGFDVLWNNNDQSIEVIKGADHYKLFIGRDEYILNGKAVASLGMAPEIVESRTFVPYTFFDKILNADVVIENKKILVNGYVDYSFDLEDDLDFTDIVVDVPVNYLEKDFYEYSYEITDAPIENMGNAIKFEGSNHSDDMFMGFYKKVDGLKANETYIYKLSFDIGTNVPKGMGGIGGSPGSSVYVKAGITDQAPIAEIDDLNHIRLSNLDKNNQSQSGKDLKVVSDMEKASDDYSENYEYKTVVRHFLATTNDNGEAYIIIGTDSGFEGLTTVYYDNIELSVKEATTYNISVLQDIDFDLVSKTMLIGDERYVSVPKADNFINVANEEKLNTLIDEKVNEIINKEELESLYFSYIKKDNGLLSIVFSGNYKIEGGKFAFYDVLNVNTRDMTEIKTEEFIKQDIESITAINSLFGEKLESKGYDRITVNNGMKIFSEQGMYAIVFLAKDSDNRETMIIFNENEIADYVNY